MVVLSEIKEKELFVHEGFLYCLVFHAEKIKSRVPEAAMVRTIANGRMVPGWIGGVAQPIPMKRDTMVQRVIIEE